MRNVRSIYLLSVLAAAGLMGCWEPEAQETLTRNEGEPGGPWGSCEPTLEWGVAGDICTFEGGCGQAAVPNYDLWETGSCSDGVLIRSEVLEERPGEGDVLVEVRHNSYYEFADPADLDWAPGEDGYQRRLEVDQSGCLVVTGIHRRANYCVDERHLPPVDDSIETVELDSPDDCAAVTGDIPTPQAACTGGVICQHQPEGGESYIPYFVWCHEGRLRYTDHFVPI